MAPVSSFFKLADVSLHGSLTQCVSAAPSYLVLCMSLLKVHPVPSSRLIMKMLKSTSPSIDLQSMLLTTSHSLRCQTLDHYPLGLMVWSVFHPLCSPPTQSISPQSSYKDAAGDFVKGLAEVKVNDTHSFPLVPRPSHLIVEDSRVGQALFFLGKSVLAVPKHFCPCICLVIASRRICSTIFQGTRVRMTCL